MKGFLRNGCISEEMSLKLAELKETPAGGEVGCPLIIVRVQKSVRVGAGEFQSFLPLQLPRHQ